MITLPAIVDLERSFYYIKHSWKIFTVSCIKVGQESRALSRCLKFRAPRLKMCATFFSAQPHLVFLPSKLEVDKFVPVSAGS